MADNFLIEEVNNLITNWKDILLSEPFKQQLATIYESIKNEDNLLPKRNLIFNAFNHFNIEDLNAVIIAQDPYPNPINPNGLAFSVNDGVPIPGSLKNIYKELMEEKLIENMPTSGNITYLAKQGVLLLNSALTVKAYESNSHAEIWKEFTDAIIKYINDNTIKTVFLLMGNFAKAKAKNVDENIHCVIKTAHPSPLSCKKFFGCYCFIKMNKYLKEKKNKEIKF